MLTFMMCSEYIYRMKLLWALEHDRLRREMVFRDRFNPLAVSAAHLLWYWSSDNFYEIWRGYKEILFSFENEELTICRRVISASADTIGFPRNEIQWLCENIGSEKSRHTTRSHSVPMATQVLVVLRFYQVVLFRV